MDRLPQDIYDEIGALLPGPAFDLPALATVSRQWQMAIERQTFRNICLRSTDLDRFQEIVQSSRRRYVNKIDYLIILPAYGDEERCRFEREDTRQANDEVFTAAIHRLFHLLKSWDVCNDGYIELCLRDVYSDGDHPFLRRSSPFYKVDTALRMRTDEDETNILDLWSWRFRFSYLRLLHTSELPIVPVVRTFWESAMTRNICDRVAIDMAAKLPSLREGLWRMNDWEIPYIALRRTHRHDLAQAVAHVLPRSSALKRLVLHMSSVFFWAPDFSIGTLDLGNSTFDTLSDAIRTATAGISTLKDLWITGTIDKSLFWPGPAHALAEPYWQNLERLSVGFSTRQPSGGGYFRDPQQAIRAPSGAEVPPGYGHSEQEDTEAAIHFSLRGIVGQHGRTLRVVPDDDSLVPLIEAFGRACLQMPMLKLANLSTFIPAPARLDTGEFSRGRAQWGVWYLSPGTWPREDKKDMDPAFSDDIHQRRLFWDVMDWRPNPDLRSLLRDIGSDRYGTNLVEKFVDTWSTVGKDQHLQRYKKSQS
ncbi:hypothetical protein TOPH_01974 [Tolypocladium ophioglossoides CBS 100239]|uniref:F-box domain-containing protein n=1 Tax=Tolypocladium ophioglossoides (strain CBS 100239) TaxID=1163406 RepID=A0A0L0NHD0_TOLOC|nr:hypothetical protein TOPH_01974 [Tolypocladium ophioglossoides CBS 100239]